MMMKAKIHSRMDDGEIDKDIIDAIEDGVCTLNGFRNIWMFEQNYEP